MQTLRYAGFSETAVRTAQAEHVPLQVTFELTRRCPLSCQHCYNNLPIGDRAAQAAELTVDDHRRILDELAELGCFWLLYTGGEILARADFLEIYRYAKNKGFIITLFTNGTQITKAIADELVVYRPLAIEITLYGRTRETYERLTGVPGSYDRCLNGIALLRERGLPVKLKTVALTINKHELEDMAAFAEELGLEFKFDPMMSPRIDCSQSPLEVRLDPVACVELDLADAQRMSEWRLFGERFLGAAARPTDEHIYSCGGGVTSFAVDPTGGMSICVLSQNDKFDLKTGTVREGWQQFLRKVRAKTAKRETKCTRCTMRSMCGMCPANGELENGDPEEPVDFLCRVAHLRAYAFGFAVPEHGVCDYCPEGAGYDELMRAAAGLKDPSQDLFQDPSSRSARTPSLAVVSTGTGTASAKCGNGGCSSCERG